LKIHLIIWGKIILKYFYKQVWKNNIYKKPYILIVLTVALLWHCQIDIAWGDIYDLGVLQPHSVIKGKKIGDWGSEWWKWAYSFEKQFSPVNDDTGQNCNLGQEGNIWFLAGSYSTKPIVRECFIPEGKILLFPIINFINHSSEKQPGSCESVTGIVNRVTQRAENLYVRINNVELKEPYSHREASSICFDPFEKAPIIINRSSGYPAASDGYWIAIKNLPIGTHILQFGGNVLEFRQNITYKLHIISTDKNHSPIPLNVDTTHFKPVQKISHFL
jgi:hypothetical protein